MIRNGLMAAATAATALAVVGCGGGDDNKTLSYSDYSKKANEVCKTEGAKIKEISSKLTGKASTDAPVYDELIPALESATDKVKDLNPPDELKSAADNFTSLLDQQVQGARDAQAKAKEGDDAAYVQQVKSLAPLDKQSDEAGSKIGAADCAND